MKKVLLILLVIGVFSACSDNGEPSLSEENNEESISEQKGFFVSGAHTTTGSVTVNGSETILSFTNFKTDTGPKLLVYLTTKVGSSDFVSLGDLKGISGNFTYNIPENTDLTKYHIVDIWCIDASVSFGHAELK
jgi:ABC-type Fe3+-hydroxamate transport system substrate-binding protein